MKTRPLTFLLWLASLSAAPAQSWHFEQHSVNEGLPQSQVCALLQDSRGYLWLGTQGGGLARFDGKAFKNFSATDGLAGNYVQALAEDPASGNLWIGTNRGVSRFDGRSFRHFELEKNRDVPVFALAADTAGTLWIAAQTGIFFLKKDSVAQLTHVAGTQVGRMTAALADSRGAVWMGGDELLVKLENGIWNVVRKGKAEVLALAETSDGSILAGIFNGGILVLDQKNRRIANTSQGLCSNKVQSLWRAPDGKIWVGTQDAGACIWDMAAGTFTQLSENQGLCNRNIRSILGDWWGGVWLGTSGSGACRFGGQEFEHFDERAGLRSNFTYALCADTSGGVWLSAGGRGVSFFKNGSFQHFGAGEGFADIKCRAIFQDRQGGVWVGTEGAGAAVFQNGSFRFFSKKNGLAGNWIRDFAEDAAGHVWVATTDGGISKINAGGLSSGSLLFQNFGLAEGLGDLTVHALHFDKLGRLWFAAQRGGIGFIQNDRVEMLGAQSSLPAATAIRCLAEDSLGYLWCGTAGRGVGRAEIYRGGKAPWFKFFDQKDSLTSANVYLLQFDREGVLWVGSETGVDKLSLDAARNVLQVRHFGRAEGFRGIETCQNASLLDRQGSLWFGTVNGLTRFRPAAADTTRSAAPKPHFTGIRLFYEPLENSAMKQWAASGGGLLGGAVFPHDQNHLGFEFFAADFSNPGKVAYSWRLEGLESEWSPFSQRREVSYANLPPGGYTFLARARSAEGAVSEPPLAVSFLIKPPFWQTWWFRLAAVAAVAAAVFGAFRGRIRQVRRKAAAERGQLEMQNRILRLEQQARQLQMNPHFIFNALNSIQSLVTSGQSDSARGYIGKFARLMRAVLDNSRQPLIQLEKEVETLRQYLEMEQFCRGGKFDFELRLDGSATSPADLQIPPMLLQPFVENAILHGVAPLTGRQGKIEVAFFEKEGCLEVLVRDNGVGVARSQEIQQEKGRRSAGIEVTRERLALMGGGVEIEDLGREGGTLARVKIPV